MTDPPVPPGPPYAVVVDLFGARDGWLDGDLNVDDAELGRRLTPAEVAAHCRCPRGGVTPRAVSVLAVVLHADAEQLAGVRRADLAAIAREVPPWARRELAAAIARVPV